MGKNIAYLWKQTLTSHIEIPSVDQYGWYLDGNVEKLKEVFPAEVETVLRELNDSRNNAETDDEEEIGEFENESDVDTDEEIF